MNSIIGVFGQYTVADVMVLGAALVALALGVKKFILWLIKLSDTVQDIYEATHKIGQLQEQIERNKKGTLALLKFRVMKECDRLLDAGHVDVHKLDELKEMYQAYHAMGGNGTAERLYKEVLKLPIK